MDGWDWWVDGWMDGVWCETLMERMMMNGWDWWVGGMDVYGGDIDGKDNDGWTDGLTDGRMDGIGRCKMFRNPAIMGMCMVIPSREFRLITHRPA